MERLHFSIWIKAPKEKVWHTMLDDATYRQWTTAFNKGSYYQGDWSEGSKILFLGPDPQTGKEGGMVSRVAKIRPNEFVSIEHLGLVHDGIEDTESPEAKKWAPAFENYTFRDKDGGTEVLVDMDSEESMAEEFSKMWPEGLKKLKEIAEK
jgi:hypothetical protein